MKLKYLTYACSLALGAAVAVPPAFSAEQQMQEHTPATGLSTSGSLESEAGMSAPESSGRQVSADSLDGTNVVNSAGDTIGEVEAIVRDNTSGRLHALVSVGGFLGIGDKKVTVPVEELEFQGDKLLAPVASTEEELKSRTAYDDDSFADVPGEEIVEIGGSAGADIAASADLATDADPVAGADVHAAPEEGAMVGFGTLDVNRDGYLSKDEAAENPTYAQEWDQIDRNSDGRIDESEFSAFEVQGSGELPRDPSSHGIEGSGDIGGSGSGLSDDSRGDVPHTPSQSGGAKAGY